MRSRVADLCIFWEYVLKISCKLIRVISGSIFLSLPKETQIMNNKSNNRAISSNVKNVICIASILLIMFGCATRKPLTRSEWLKMTTCEFPGKTVDEVLAAGEQVLRLCDSGDVEIYHMPNKMGATRRYNFYAVFTAVFGQFNFDLTAFQEKGFVKAQLLIGSSAQGINPAMTYTPGVQGGAGGIGVTAATGSVNVGMPSQHKEIYTLFFLRMKSILYGDKWYTCDEAVELLFPEQWKKAKKEGEMLRSESGEHSDDVVPVGFELESLCLLADDRKPEQ
jgi:hypothetical protein